MIQAKLLNTVSEALTQIFKIAVWMVSIHQMEFTAAHFLTLQLCYVLELMALDLKDKHLTQIFSMAIPLQHTFQGFKLIFRIAQLI